MLWIARHGQSAGNVARDAAEVQSLTTIDIATRDVDTPLSALGEQQSRALGRWFRDLSLAAQPNVLLTSPYLRARSTALLIAEAGAFENNGVDLVSDERLREKEFGILDRRTRRGIVERYPELAEQRSRVGKFYFRPPGGESWCDVILRLRSLLDTIVREHSGERVLIVTHQVVVNCLRYLLERLDERQILGIDRAVDVPNCSVTSYEFDRGRGNRGKLLLKLVNYVAPLEAVGAPITSAPDVPAAPKS